MAKEKKKQKGRPPKPIKEALAKQMAALALTGANRADIAKSLKLTQHEVHKTFKSQEFKDYCKQLGDDAAAAAKSMLISKTSDLARDILNALTYQLREKNSIEAVKVGLKILGFEQEEQVKQDTSIQVVLPTIGKEKHVKSSVDADYKVQDGDSGEGV